MSVIVETNLIETFTSLKYVKNLFLFTNYIEGRYLTRTSLDYVDTD